MTTQESNQKEPPLTVAQAAQRLNVSPAQVRAFILQDKLRAFDIGMRSRREWRIEPSAIDEFIQAQTKTPEPKRTIASTAKIKSKLFMNIYG